MFSNIMVLLLGCGSGKDDALADSEANQAGTDTGERLDTDTGPDGADEPTWWTLRADITITDGLPVADDARFQVSLLDGTLAVMCEAEVGLLAIGETKLPDPSIYTWWIVEPSLPTACDADGLTLPAGLLLGVGALHPDIQARLITEGAVDPAPLNGAYASLDGGKTLLVFGAAGLPAAWAGDGSPVAEPPLGDGRWSLRSVFSFEVSL